MRDLADIVDKFSLACSEDENCPSGASSGEEEEETDKKFPGFETLAKFFAKEKKYSKKEKKFLIKRCRKGSMVASEDWINEQRVKAVIAELITTPGEGDAHASLRSALFMLSSLLPYPYLASDEVIYVAKTPKETNSAVNRSHYFKTRFTMGNLIKYRGYTCTDGPVAVLVGGYVIRHFDILAKLAHHSTPGECTLVLKKLVISKNSSLGDLMKDALENLACLLAACLLCPCCSTVVQFFPEVEDYIYQTVGVLCKRSKNDVKGLPKPVSLKIAFGKDDNDLLYLYPSPGEMLKFNARVNTQVATYLKIQSVMLCEGEARQATSHVQEKKKRRDKRKNSPGPNGTLNRHKEVYEEYVKTE